MVHPRVAAGAERDHRLQERLARDAMMDRNGMLAATGGTAYAAAVVVPFQDTLPQTSEIAGIMLPEGVAGCTMTVGTDLFSPAPAVERPLCVSLHGNTMQQPLLASASFATPRRSAASLLWV